MEQSKKIKQLYPYFILGIATILLLVRCWFSFCWSDETFYFSTAYRFYQGDSIFQHDWFPTQLSSVMLLPIITAFINLTGSTTGVILFFRICYVIFSLICSIAIFRILRYSYKEWVSLVCSLMLLFYAHLNIATLSYYTMSVSFYLLSMLCILHYYHTQKKRHLLIGGVLFSLSVLALPTMAVAYFIILFCIVVLVLLVLFLPLPVYIKTTIERARLNTVIFYTFLGICIPAVIFLLFLISNVSIQNFINAIPYVLSDEEHITSLTFPIRKFFIGINEVYGYAAYAGYFLILVTGLIAFANAFGKWNNRLLKQLLLLIDFTLFICYFICSIGHTGYIQTALCLCALPVFFLTQKRNWYLFFLLYVPGMVFALVYSYSSNGYLYILSLGHFIASIGSTLMLYEFTQEMTSQAQSRASKCLVILFTCVILVGLMQTISLRLINVYRDAPLSRLTAQLQSGPAKGLYTTEEHRQMYDTVLQTLNTHCQSENLDNPDQNSSIFITKLLPFGYMCTDLRCGSPTTWRTPFNSKRLEDYYTVNPDKIPDLILILNEQYGSYETSGDVVADPIPNQNELDGYLLDYVTKENYEVIDVGCGVLYKKP